MLTLYFESPFKKTCSFKDLLFHRFRTRKLQLPNQPSQRRLLTTNQVIMISVLCDVIVNFGKLEFLTLNSESLFLMKDLLLGKECLEESFALYQNHQVSRSY